MCLQSEEASIARAEQGCTPTPGSCSQWIHQTLEFKSTVRILSTSDVDCSSCSGPMQRSLDIESKSHQRLRLLSLRHAVTQPARSPFKFGCRCPRAYCSLPTCSQLGRVFPVCSHLTSMIYLSIAPWTFQDRCRTT